MSSADGDYIGTESCINDVNFDDIKIEAGSPVVMKKQSNRRKTTEKREFPPPIPLMALGTHNASSHVPWELNRYYTGDGRLIIREEKPRHHHFFRVHRSNGRLTLQLVPLDPVFPTGQFEELEPVTPSHAGDDETDNDGTGQVIGEEGPNSPEAEGLPRETSCNLNFNRVSSASSCLFEKPVVHPIRTVHG